MNFSIGFIKNFNNTAEGQIRIDGFEEKFESSLEFWSIDDYKNHWINAIESIVDGKSYSYLITAMYDPQVANFLIIWPIYRIGNLIYIQNRLLFLEHLKKDFSFEEIARHILDRKTENDEGLEISEWQTDIYALEEFLKNSR